MEGEKALNFNEMRSEPQERLQEIADNRFPITLVLDRLNDPGNIGMLFRLGEACRIQRIICWKMPPSEPGKKAAKVARTALKYIPFYHEKTISGLKERLEGVQPVALEYTNRSIPYTDFKIKGPVALLVGNEQKGLDPALLNLARESIHLPMYGLNTSINVACATSVALYAMAQQLAAKNGAI